MLASQRNPSAMGTPTKMAAHTRGLCEWNTNTGALATPTQRELRDCTNEVKGSAAKPGHLVKVAGEQKWQELMVTGMEVNKRTKMGGWVKRVFYLGSDKQGVPKLIVEKRKVLAEELTGNEKGILVADVGSLLRVSTRGSGFGLRIVPHSTCAPKSAREFVLKLPTERARDIVIERLAALLKGMGIMLETPLEE